MSTATLQPNATFSGLPAGGGYSADQNADGTWNIRDVPVFSAHKREGMPRVGRVWLERAVGRSQQDRASGYVAPLHVAHHNSGQPVSAAGQFVLTRVADFSFAGKAPLPTAFADFLNVPAAAYELIKAGKLPYRSIEAADLRVAEINSIALLDHDAPYFKFPLLSVGSERPHAAKASAQAMQVSFNDRKGTMRVHYSASAKPAAGKVDAKAKFAAGVADAMAKAKEAGAAAIAQLTETVNGITEQLGAMADELGLVEGEAPAEDEVPADEPMPEEADADAGPDEDEKDEDMKPAEQPAKSQAVAASAGALPAGLPTEVKAQFAAMAGRLKVLEGEQAATKKATAKTMALAKATKELEGYAGDFSKDLAEAFDLGGEKNLTLYVRHVKAMGVQAPPESFTGDLPPPNEPAEVTAYAVGGPAKLREARHLNAVYSASPGWVQKTPLVEYLATQMGPPPAKK